MEGMSDKKIAYLLLILLWLVWGNFWVVSKNALPIMGGAWMLSTERSPHNFPKA